MLTIVTKDASILVDCGLFQGGKEEKAKNRRKAQIQGGKLDAVHDVKGPCLIMAGNGMCTGGRITHHLRHNLPLSETVVLIVGFQSQGSLGRKLVDGAESAMIFGQEVPVKASIHTMGGFSGHAGQKDLLSWFASVAPSRPRTIIPHGEDRARKVFSDLIGSRFGLKAERPALGDVIEI